jgi:hypothetical protein
MKQIMDGYSIGSNVICLLSLFAGLAVIYKLTRRPRGLMRGNSAMNGPHSMKRFMDQVVRVRVCVDGASVVGGQFLHHACVELPGTDARLNASPDLTP